MSKLDWEKQNRRELPKEYLEDMERHAKKRASQKKYRLKKKAKAIQRKDTPKDRRQSFEAGKQQEQERILKRVNDLINAVVDYTLTPSQYDKAAQRISEVIKGENK